MNILLNWISTKTSLDFRYLFQQGNWVSLRFLVVSISGFLLSLVFAKFGTKELLGQYQLVLSIMSIVSVVSFLGLNSSVMEAVVQGREAGVLKGMRIIFLFSWIGLPILAMIGLFYIYLLGQAVLGQMLIFSAFLFPFFYAVSTWSTFYEGKQMFRESVLRAISLNIVLTALLIAGILNKLNAFWLLGIYLVTNIILQGKYLLTIYRRINDKVNDLIDIKFGIAVTLQKFVSGLSNNLPPLAISFYFGVERLAIYYIAYFFVSALSSFFNNIFSIYFPILFRKIKLDHRSILLNNLIAGIGGWVLFIIFLKLFFILLYGNEYYESLELAFRISFLLLLMPFHVYLVGFFSTQRQNGFLISVFSIANLIGLLVLYLTIQKGYLFSVSTYLYSLETIITIPLIVRYLFSVIKTKD